MGQNVPSPQINQQMQQNQMMMSSQPNNPMVNQTQHLQGQNQMQQNQMMMMPNGPNNAMVNRMHQQGGGMVNPQQHQQGVS